MIAENLPQPLRRALMTLATYEAASRASAEDNPETLLGQTAYSHSRAYETSLDTVAAAFGVDHDTIEEIRADAESLYTPGRFTIPAALRS